MATVQDVIEQAFQFTGIPEAVGGLSALTVGSEALSVAEQKTIASTLGLSTAFEVLAANPIVGAVLGIAAVVGGLATAVKAFGEADLSTVRLSQQMQNLGNVFPTEDLLDFASALSRTTGIDDELIASLGGVAARFGLARNQIERLLPTVLDISAQTGIDPAQVEQTLLRASRGRKQGLIALGIDPSKVKGDITDINNLVEQLNHQFQGSAEAVRQTVPAALQALATSFGNLLESLGRLFGFAAVSLINKLADAVQGLADQLESLADFLGIPTQTPVKGGAGDLAFTGDPEQTRILDQIEGNTRDTKNALIEKVIGGGGQVASRAYTWRDVQIALQT